DLGGETVRDAVQADDRRVAECLGDVLERPVHHASASEVWVFMEPRLPLLHADFIPAPCLDRVFRAKDVEVPVAAADVPAPAARQEEPSVDAGADRIFDAARVTEHQIVGWLD